MAIISFRQTPNIITVLRIFLVIPIFMYLMEGDYHTTFYLFVVAAASDLLDGSLARFFKCTSEMGAILDPVADKLLMLVSYFGLAWQEKLPIWLFSIVVFRDIWLVGGALVYRYLIDEIKFEPSIISKINTFLQMLLVVVMLINLSIFDLPELLIKLLMLTVLITTVASFVDYTWTWSRRAIAVRCTSHAK